MWLSMASVLYFGDDVAQTPTGFAGTAGSCESCRRRLAARSVSNARRGMSSATNLLCNRMLCDPLPLASDRVVLWVALGRRGVQPTPCRRIQVIDSSFADIDSHSERWVGGRLCILCLTAWLAHGMAWYHAGLRKVGRQFLVRILLPV